MTVSEDKESNNVVDKLNDVVHSIVQAREKLRSVRSLDLNEAMRAEDPLKFASEVAQMIHSYTTRLAVAARPPITEDALYKYTEDMANIVAPLVVCVEAVSESVYGHYMHNKVAQYAERILLGMEAFLRSVSPCELGHITEEWKVRGRLVSTGMLWESCERMTALGQGLVTALQSEWKEMESLLEDASSDLQDWIDGEDEDDWDLLDSDSESENEQDKKDTSAPEESPRTTKQLELGKLVQNAISSCRILFKATGKRRLVESSEPKYLDSLYEAAQGVSSTADYLVAQIQMDSDDTDTQMIDFDKSARKLAQVAAEKEDTFQKWFLDWIKNWETKVTEKVSK
ncbi:fungal protein [Schizosaccharomyces japonicus yFS275]|uniref:Fungal protein n=1 Tax=Schizosaccharomyces japonicus (strain yFS275 / FY16936) TaxID=402676 RepID=B6K6Q2_SCHJY|nr:fungal protein [Schizosaccharomyces japonicus yFS275]EEB09206.1 fungal protein [Schizosaccharomyces japonicus yFS275]